MVYMLLRQRSGVWECSVVTHNLHYARVEAGMAAGAGAGAPADHAALLGALRRTMELAVDR